MAQRIRKKKSKVDRFLKKVNRKANIFVKEHKSKCEKKIAKINALLEKRLESRIIRIEFWESGQTDRGLEGTHEEGLLSQEKCESVAEEVPAQGQARLHVHAKGEGQVQRT